MEHILRNEVFQVCSCKMQREVQFQPIFTQNTDFQVGQEIWNL